MTMTETERLAKTANGCLTALACVAVIIVGAVLIWLLFF